MNNFVGTWNTLRYSGSAPQSPEVIEVSFKLDSDGLALDGSYPMVGFDGRIKARVDDTGRVLDGSFEDGATNHSGQFRFILADGGSAFFGGWTSPSDNDHSAYQFWVGRRAP